MIHFVVPAFNEAENIPELFADLIPEARRREARVILVDDGSSDGTAEAVDRFRDGYPVHLVQHQVNRGLGRALNSGIRAAIEGADQADAIITLEADNTSDLGDLDAMLAKFGEGYDVVCASVYAPGGSLLGVDAWRVLLSRALSAMFRVVGRIREVHTFSSLYRVYRAGPLRSAALTYGYLLVREPGYASCVELLLKLRDAGLRVAEVPTTNDWSRRRGTSKMRIRPTLLAYGRLVVAHLAGLIQPPPVSPLAGETDHEGRPVVRLLGREDDR